MQTFVYYSAPNSFTEIWKRLRDHVQYEMRNPNDIYIRSHRLVSYSNHPYFSFPKLWNELPSYLKAIQDFSFFKSELKIYLLNSLEPPQIDVQN